MIDFMIVATKCSKKGVIEIYPKSSLKRVPIL